LRLDHRGWFGGHDVGRLDRRCQLFDRLFDWLFDCWCRRSFAGVGRHFDASNQACRLKIRSGHQVARKLARLGHHAFQQSELAETFRIDLQIVRAGCKSELAFRLLGDLVQAALSVKLQGQQPLEIEQPQDPTVLRVAHIKIEHTLRVLDGFTAQIGAKSGRCHRHG